jgi:hypothetical protein
MTESIRVGDRVKVLLDSQFWESEGWFEGIVVRIDPYSEHRSFYWVELAETVAAKIGSSTKLLSVLNPRNIEKM